MGYTKSGLKPVKEKSHRGALIGLLVAFVVGVAAVSLIQRTGWHSRVEGRTADDEGDEVRKGGVSGRAQLTPRVAYDKLLLGDYSDLQDEGFRRCCGVDITEVKKIYNPYRHDYVYRYRTNECAEDSEKVLLHAYYSDECSNRLVTQCFSNFWVAKSRRGFAEILEDLLEKINWLSSHACEDNKIVSSSPNIHYRGYNKDDAKDDLAAAVVDVMGNGSVWAMVQWKTPKCYIEWRLVRITLGEKTVYETLITYSDQLIREEDDWKESALEF